MSARPEVRRVARLVTDPAHIVTETDGIETACHVPAHHPEPRFAGRRFVTSTMACNIPGAVGIPAAAFMDAGLKVWEDWLVEVRDHRVVRHIGRVFGAQSLWPEGRPS